jgi:hypothetical protein
LAPEDLTPNTFEKISFSERWVGRVLSSTEYGLNIKHILSSGNIVEWSINFQVGPLAEKTRGQVSYILADRKTHLVWYWEKLKWPYNSNNTYYGVELQWKF